MTWLQTSGSGLRTTVYTISALAAFAANSVLCRLALAGASIDAATFSVIRLFSGAIALVLLTAALKKRKPPESRGNWISAAMLFLYAVAFSFAYISLSTASGALILFGAVQATMILSALTFGEKPGPLEWAGLVLALSGLVYLVLPGLTAPSPEGFSLMVVAGISWGIYSLRGRRAADPLIDTTQNFVRSLPMVLIVSLAMMHGTHVSTRGVMLAVLSGALTSGMGYVAWYAALGGLSATRAATVQLSVPVLAALGGVVFLSEDISVRLVLSAILILGGVGLAVTGGNRQNRRHRPGRL